MGAFTKSLFFLVFFFQFFFPESVFAVPANILNEMRRINGQLADNTQQLQRLEERHEQLLREKNNLFNKAIAARTNLRRQPQQPIPGRTVPIARPQATPPKIQSTPPAMPTPEKSPLPLGEIIHGVAVNIVGRVLEIIPGEGAIVGDLKSRNSLEFSHGIIHPDKMGDLKKGDHVGFSRLKKTNLRVGSFNPANSGFIHPYVILP